MKLPSATRPEKRKASALGLGCCVRLWHRERITVGPRFSAYSISRAVSSWGKWPHDQASFIH